MNRAREQKRAKRARRNKPHRALHSASEPKSTTFAEILSYYYDTLDATYLSLTEEKRSLGFGDCTAELAEAERRAKDAFLARYSWFPDAWHQNY